MTDQSATPRVMTKGEFARAFKISGSLLDRAISHGLVRIIRFGGRPLIPIGEADRIALEGLPPIPPGYRRVTSGPSGAGRPRGRRPAGAASQ